MMVIGVQGVPWLRNAFTSLVGESTWKEDGSCGDSGGENSVAWENAGDIVGWEGLVKGGRFDIVLTDFKARPFYMAAGFLSGCVALAAAHCNVKKA